MPKHFADLELRYDLPEGTMLLCTPEVPILLPSSDPRTNYHIPAPSRFAFVDPGHQGVGAVVEVETMHDLHLEVGSWLRTLAGGKQPDATTPQPLAPWAPLLAGAAFAWGDPPAFRTGGPTSLWEAETSGRLLTHERDPATWRLAGWLNQWWQSVNDGTDLVWEAGMTEASVGAWTSAAGPLHDQRELLARVLGAVHPRAFARALDALTAHEQSPGFADAILALEEEHLVSAGTFQWSDALLDAPGEDLELMLDGETPTFGQMLAHARAHTSGAHAEAEPIGASAAREAHRWIREHGKALELLNLAPLAEGALAACRNHLAQKPHPI